MTISSTPRPRVERSLELDLDLRARAARVIPGGMYGHMQVKEGMMPSDYPQFYREGRGTRTWDVDGNEYIDFMCSFGPMLVGYANTIVDAAAGAQQALGDPLMGPTARMVELAELLTETVAHADWAVFAKNGTDATSIAVMIARSATGRKKLLKAGKAYHGANAWFTPSPAGVTPEDRANIVDFEYNDIAAMEAAVAANEGDVAAIILPPFRHDAMADQELVDPAFARAARAIADRVGAVLILDEVRTGFRFDPRGSWEPLGVRPDLTAFSKGMANGYALAAVTGIESLTEATNDVYFTGSFWCSGVAMAAALATIPQVVNGGQQTMVAAGNALREGLDAQATAHGFLLHQTGPVQMPILRFDEDPAMETMFAFTNATIRRGVLLHPWHNMFLSSAHTLDDVAQALERTNDAFDEISHR